MDGYEAHRRAIAGHAQELLGYQNQWFNDVVQQFNSDTIHIDRLAFSEVASDLAETYNQVRRKYYDESGKINGTFSGLTEAIALLAENYGRAEARIRDSFG